MAVTNKRASNSLVVLPESNPANAPVAHGVFSSGKQTALTVPPSANVIKEPETAICLAQMIRSGVRLFIAVFVFCWMNANTLYRTLGGLL